MKNKILIFICIIMIFGSVSISAASAMAHGPTTMQIGTTGKIGLKTPTTSNMSGNVISSNPGIVELVKTGSQYNENIFTLDTGQTFNIKAVGIGESIITFTGVGYEEDTGNKFSINTSIKIKVEDKKTPTPSNPEPKPPVLDNTEGEKGGITQTPEEKLAIEAERKRVELEALKLVPLVKKMSFTSNSTKMNGQLIDTINFVNSQFDYEVTLPQNINSILIDVPSVEGVELSYDKEITLGSDVESQVIEVKAKQGEIDQVIKVKINKNTTPLIEREFSKEKLDVYHDNQMNAFFKGFGYEAVVDETVGTYYDNTFTKFQMLVEDDNNAIFFTLNDSLELETKISLMVSESDELFLINSEANPESTINGNPKTKIVFENLLQFTEIDSSLIVDANVYGWDLEEGLVVEGLTSQGIESKFLITEANDLVKVLVPNDVEAPADYVKLASGIGFIALLSTNIIYFVTREIRKRRNEVIY